MTNQNPKMNTLLRSLVGALLGLVFAFLAPFLLGLLLAFVEVAMDVFDGRFRVKKIGGAFVLAAGVSIIWGLVMALPATVVGGVLGGLSRRRER